MEGREEPAGEPTVILLRRAPNPEPAMPAADQNWRAGDACPRRQIGSTDPLPVAQAFNRWQCLRQEMKAVLIADAHGFEVSQRRPAAQACREPATGQGVHGYETLRELD